MKPVATRIEPATNCFTTSPWDPLMVTSTLKSPMFPPVEVTSAFVRRVIFGSAAISFSSLASSSLPSVPSGLILSKADRCPPTLASLSIRYTSSFILARDIAAFIPATPAPITATDLFDSIMIGSRDSARRAFAIAALTRLIAFSVAPTLLSEWAHEPCSLIFAWT